MKKSNQELIQQKNNDSELECKKCNKGLSWLMALVVFINFTMLAGIFHTVWNFNLSGIENSQNNTARKLEEVLTKLESQKTSNLIKVEQTQTDKEIELLEKAANKYHVALYAFRISEKFAKDLDFESEVNELGKFEKDIETKSHFQTIKNANYSTFSKDKIKESLEEYENELTSNATQDESWLGNVKKRIGSLVKIEQKELLEKSNATRSHLKTARLMLEMNQNASALESLNAINDVKLISAQEMLEQRIKISNAINEILKEAL